MGTALLVHGTTAARRGFLARNGGSEGHPGTGRIDRKAIMMFRLEAMPDFSQPGADGAVPFSMSEWSRGTVYTVRPEMLVALERGREYRCTAIVRRRGADLGDYENLYHRASMLAFARAAAARCSASGDALHTWIKSHYWGTLQIGQLKVRAACVSTSLLFPNASQERPMGEVPPTAEQLLIPGGASLESFSAPPPNGAPSGGELYNDFDYAVIPGPGMFSYGEYVSSADDVDFEPFVARAEAAAKIGGATQGFVAREWYCTRDPTLAVVHLYYE